MSEATLARQPASSGLSRAALGRLLALLLPLALLGGLGAVAARMLGHRRRERALDMA
jgi:hypothetical protein